MAITALSDSAQNHLKTIWSLTEWSEEPVTAAALAQALGLRRSTVSDALKRLREQGLVEHAPYGTVTLTPVGRQHAVAMVRRHRLIETFLVETLGYTWDQVHDEAEVLEHSVSEFMVERIAQVLGNPEHDPHGDPIPAADGTIQRPDALPLTALLERMGEARTTGSDPELTVTVARISDVDPAVLQDFAALGLGVGSRLQLVLSSLGARSTAETASTAEAASAADVAGAVSSGVVRLLPEDASTLDADLMTLRPEHVASLYVSLETPDPEAG